MRYAFAFALAYAYAPPLSMRKPGRRHENKKKNRQEDRYAICALHLRTGFR